MNNYDTFVIEIKLNIVGWTQQNALPLRCIPLFLIIIINHDDKIWLKVEQSARKHAMMVSQPDIRDCIAFVLYFQINYHYN
jgi:hypothetical protein